MNLKPLGWLCRKTVLLLWVKVPPAHSRPQIQVISQAMFIETHSRPQIQAIGQAMFIETGG
jgi:hypothetical protein